MEVTIAGIDGSGKSTFAKKVENEWSGACNEVTINQIDVPYFRELDCLFAVTKIERRIWRRADCNHSTVIVLIASLGAIVLYLIARWRYRKSDIILTEQHPVVSCPAYARLYAGRLGGVLAGVVHRFWPQPDFVYLLDLSEIEAYRRICERGKLRQPHETARQLRELRGLLHQSSLRFRANQAVVDIDATA